MIADIQTQDLIVTDAPHRVEYVIVQDSELANVGGGTTSMSF